MKRSLIIFSVACIFFTMLSDISFAVTVTAAPSTINVGQTVTVNANAAFSILAPACIMNINYGDGTGTVSIGTCPGGTPTCSFSGSHTYTGPGSFTIALTTQALGGGPCTLLTPPASATTTVGVGGGALSVSAIPSQVSIPQGQSSSTGIQYQVRTTSPINAQAGSPSGVFIARDGIISTNNAPISATIRNGFGSATETIVVPIGLVERVLQMGQNRFSYRRSFSVSGTSIGTTSIDFVISTEAAASLGIKKIDLYFENRRPEVTIERGHKGLKAFADISYTGTGIFEGYWEVDGRVISRVFQQLSFGGLLKLQTPDIPELPTFDPGTHRIRFVITRPTQPGPTPVIIYFVDLDRIKSIPVAIKLIAPQDKVSIEYASRKFEWERPANASVFLVQYGDKLEAKALLSAYTREAFYVLSDEILKTSFKAGGRYYWKVIGFDDENNITSESVVQSFIFIAGGNP